MQEREERKKKRVSVSKVWIESEGRHALGRGGAEILKAVDRAGSITKAARLLKMSYKYVWDYLADMERALGKPVIRTHRGGKFGGGGAELTEDGRILLNEYDQISSYLNDILNDSEYWEAVGLKISARNRLKGMVTQVEEGIVTAKIKIEIKVPTTVTSVITREATRQLGIKEGDVVEAVIKATEVMIAKP